MGKKSRLRESVDGDQLVLHEARKVELIAPQDARGTAWDVVLIATGFSKNTGPSGLPRYYSEATLRRAIREGVFEGLVAKTYRFGRPVIGDEFNHLPDEGRATRKDFAENQVGFFENVRYEDFKRPDGSRGEGIIGKMVLFEGAKALRENMVDAYRHGRPDLYGLSIDADGTARVGVAEGKRAEIVSHIVGAHSTDIVSEPAAGGSILRLVASFEGEASMNLMQLLKLIEQRRPTWLKGVPSPAPDQAEADYLKHIAESAVTQSGDAIVQAGTDEQKLQAASDMQMAQKLMELLKAGKTGDAMSLLQQKLQSGAKAEMEEGTKNEPATVKVDVDATGVEAAAKTLQDGAAAMAAAAQAGADAQASTAVAEALAEANALKEQAAATVAELNALKEQAAKDASKTLVDGLVNGTDLHEATKTKIKGEFAGMVGITEANVKERIAEEREYLANFSESGRVRGLGDAHSVVTGVQVGQDQFDKMSLAMQGMFEGEDVEGVARFRSLTESWRAFNMPFGTVEETGELMFKSAAAALPKRITSRGWAQYNSPLAKHQKMLRESWGSYVPQSLRESVTTADWAVAFGDALFRRLQKAYSDDPLNDWKIVSDIMSLGDWTNKVKILRHGAVETLPVVNEKAPYQPLVPATPTEEVEELEPDKYGGTRCFTMEDMMADRLNVLRRITTDLGRAAVRTIHEKVWDEFETNAAIQGNALLSVANQNLVTGSPALSYDAVGAAVRLLRDQQELGSGRRLGLKPAYLIHGTALEQEAIEITESRVKQTAAEDAQMINVINRWGIKPLTTLGVGRTLATENHWWVITDKRDCELVSVGFPGGRERPDIFVQGKGQETQGSVFDADAITFKVRLIFGVKMVDYRGVTGSLA